MPAPHDRRVAALASHVSPPGLPGLAPNPTSTPRATDRVGGFTVAVLGAAGGIGQPLSLLLKQNTLVAALNLYDVAAVVAGVAADISHVNTPAHVRGFAGPAQLGAALAGADLVVIPAGVPRKPGMTRDDLFAVNAGIVSTLVDACATHCPRAIVNVISNPVNSTVPIAAEVLKRRGCFDPRKLLGVTHLDVVRARTFVAEAKGLDPAGVDVPVVGGHAGATILPLLSQTRPFPRDGFTPEEVAFLTNRIQNGGTEVVEAKAGAGSATLSMAAAAAQFADACLRGLAGARGVVECAFTLHAPTFGNVLKGDKDAPAFFASKVQLGRHGVERHLGIGRLDEGEKRGLEIAKKELAASVAKGVAFVANAEKAASSAERGARDAGRRDARAAAGTFHAAGPA